MTPVSQQENLSIASKKQEKEDLSIASINQDKKDDTPPAEVKEQIKCVMHKEAELEEPSTQSP